MGRQDKEVLIAQSHSPDDDLAFIRRIEPILLHRNYIRVDGKPLLAVYRPSLFPDAKATADRWRGVLSHRRPRPAIPGGSAIAPRSGPPEEYGFDAAIQFPPHAGAKPLESGTLADSNTFEGTDTRLRGHQAKFRQWTRSRAIHAPSFPASCRRGTTRHGGWLNRAHLAECNSPVVLRLALPGGRFRARNGPLRNGSCSSTPGTNGPKGATWSRTRSSATPGLTRREWRWSRAGCRDQGAEGTAPLTPCSPLPAPGSARPRPLRLARRLRRRRAARPLDPGNMAQGKRFGRTAVHSGRTWRARRGVCGGRAGASHGRIQGRRGGRVCACGQNSPVVLRSRCFGRLSQYRRGRPHGRIDSLPRRATGGRISTSWKRAFAAWRAQKRWDSLQARAELHRRFRPGGRKPARQSLDSTGTNPGDRRIHQMHRLVGCLARTKAALQSGTEAFVARQGRARLRHHRLAQGSRPVRRNCRADVRELCSAGGVRMGRRRNEPRRNRATEATRRDRRGWQSQVRFVGPAPTPLPYMLAADVFLLSSREDPFPLVCLEAADCGLPVLCFADAGGMPLFVQEDAGAVVPYLDVDEMANQLRSFLADEARGAGLRRAWPATSPPSRSTFP